MRAPYYIEDKRALEIKGRSVGHGEKARRAREKISYRVRLNDTMEMRYGGSQRRGLYRKE